jgi:MFS family permease
MVYTGSVGMVFCIMMISLCQSFWQFLLAQGVLLGVSMALSTWPMIALVGQYFKRSRAAATGIVIAGSSLGGIIWPIVIDRLLNNTSLGFPWTMRILGFIMIPLMMFSCAAAKSPSRTSTPLETGAQEEKKVDGEDKAAERRAAVKMLLKQPALQLTCFAMFMVYFGLFAPIFYLPSFAAEAGFSTTLAFYTASIVNGASFLGRILPGFVADRYGKFNCIVVAAVSSGVVILCWTRATSVAGLVIWSAAYGFVSGVCPVHGSISEKAHHTDTARRAFYLSNKRALLNLRLSPPSVLQSAQSRGPQLCRKLFQK